MLQLLLFNTELPREQALLLRGQATLLKIGIDDPRLIGSFRRIQANHDGATGGPTVLD
jgi:hypothetical protein